VGKQFSLTENKKPLVEKLKKNCPEVGAGANRKQESKKLKAHIVLFQYYYSGACHRVCRPHDTLDPLSKPLYSHAVPTATIITKSYTKHRHL
jgi:hypothetical protein